MDKISIFWFRRDLRLEDNAGLFHALKGDHPVLPLFIFDEAILGQLADKDDARVHFIYQTLLALLEQLEGMGSSLQVEKGLPVEVWKKLLKQYDIQTVYTNHDFEPYALKRDQEVEDLLAAQSIPFLHYKDQVIFEKEEVLKDDGTPYTVFTPYSRKWKRALEQKVAKADDLASSFYLRSYPTEKYFSNFFQTKALPIPSLKEIGFEPSSIIVPPTEVSRGRIRNYADTRNFPAVEGTSRLGLHFRFGTISIREKARNAVGLSEVYLNELIWRDFYAMILAHFPHVVKGPFRKKYEWIEWRNNEEEFEAWCEGKTGYPIVDAGMRELNTTGYMHNRVRMITASFLTKHLLIDWRWGEAWFARKLLDFDLASNNGGWQWAAGCGTDAAPYFRIFNPYTQQKKFDKDFKYVKEWVPEYDTDDYPAPIVEHAFARNRCLEVYKKGLAMAEV